MQLPGLSTDPIRITVDVTWWPQDGSFSLSRKVTSRRGARDQWDLEELATSGSPIRPCDIEERWDSSTASALAYLCELVGILQNEYPFADGPTPT